MSLNTVNISGNINNKVVLSAQLSNLLNISAGIGTTDSIIGAQVQIPKVIMSEVYSGDYEIKPQAHHDIILDTNGKTLIENVVVKKIPYYETSNETGYTVYIANEVN